MASIAPPAHTRRSTTTDDWITPKWLIERLGPFDLDPCASQTQPWPCAAKSICLPKCGLRAKWPSKSFVWLNPPYGKATAKWLDKLAQHNNGIALVFARTETRMFFNSVWPKMRSVLFLEGRLTFYRPDGSRPATGNNSGGPSVLIAYGDRAERILSNCPDLGKNLLSR